MEEHFAEHLDRKIRAHVGWGDLESFGEALAAAPLARPQLKAFLASTGLFFREIPGGILALASRVTDDRIAHDRFGGVTAGARILYAAVDEFGLGGSDGDLGRSHHQLFVDMAARLGLSEADLLDELSIIPQAAKLATVTQASYRGLSVPAAVGFHYASEITSDLEFHLCMQGLSVWADDYKLAADQSAASDEDFFSFYFVHTVVEPQHGATGAEAVALYANNPQQRGELLAGVKVFMDAYGAFWAELADEMFGGEVADSLSQQA